MIRQFPFMDIAGIEKPFPMMIISLSSGDMFSPLSSVFLKEDQEQDFILGINIIKKLALKVIVACPKGQLHFLKKIKECITHIKEAL